MEVGTRRPGQSLGMLAISGYPLVDNGLFGGIMPNIPLTNSQIAAGLHSGYSLAPAQFTFSIANAFSTWSDYAGGEPSLAGYRILTAAQAAAYRAAIAAWDALIAPDFVEITETASSRGKLRIAFTSMDPGVAGYAYQGSNQVPTSKVGDIWLNTSNADQSYAQGTGGYFTMIHEIGHSLGLSHSFVQGSDITPIPAPTGQLTQSDFIGVY